MARKTKARGTLKRRGGAAVAAPPGGAGLALSAGDPTGDDAMAAWTMESPEASRADIERVDERSAESIDSLTEPAADDGSASAIEAATDDPAQAQAPPHLVER